MPDLELEILLVQTRSDDGEGRTRPRVDAWPPRAEDEDPEPDEECTRAGVAVLP